LWVFDFFARVSATYAYKAFSQRVKKTVGSRSTHFAYDEEGNLAGEYASSGARVAEHIYLGDLPIGVAFGAGSVMRVHADYLGTPRAITNGSTLVWKWDSTDPFGANLPSVQTVVYNPRFPGQYYDAESGLHYNHHRTYDPSLGRYVQPDPIGLAGGKNPFNYANQNPLNAVDPDGLMSWPTFGPDGAGFDFSINGRDNPVRQLWEESGRKAKGIAPDYVSGSLSFYVISIGKGVNLHNGNIYNQGGLARAYPGYSLKPSFSLTFGKLMASKVDAERVDKFLTAAGTQASAFVPAANPYIGVGGGVSCSYGGDCGIDCGFGSPGASVTPINYGKRVEK
jgi:RHS repeat-associated protein